MARGRSPRQSIATRHCSRPARILLGAGVALLLVALAGIALKLSRKTFPGVPAQPFQLESQSRVFSQYAGSKSCAECHLEAYNTWSRSHHGLAERPIQPDLDRAAFDPAHEFQHATQTTRVERAGATFRIITTGLSRHSEPHTVDRVIGVDPLRQFLVPFPGGRHQTLEASFDPRSNEWFNVYGLEDRQPGEWGHWTGRGMNWNSMCAVCHNTRLRKNYDPQSDTFRTAQVEWGVGCESCHGPQKAHVAWQLANRGLDRTDPTLRKPNKDQTLDTCGSCHARRSEITGDFKPGDSFHDHHLLTVVDHSDTYHPDGQVRDENYEFAAFLGSRMHAAGVRCLDCHAPHSGRTLFEGNALCMRCHNGSHPNSPKIDPVAHSFHKPDSAGNLCVNCHMPRTVYMQRHARHDHGFTIPDPLLTRQHGIPNACNRCHQDKDTDWSLAAVEEWYGAKMDRPARQRTQVIAAARAGDASARDPLLRLLQGTDTPYWKAVAAGLLGRWVSQPAVQAGLTNALAHTNALVRAHATRALAPLAEAGDPATLAAVRGRLDDPARNVRQQAAWALRAHLDLTTRAAGEMLHALHHNSDQPVGQLQLGAFHLARTNLPAAISHFRKAVDWDPFSAPLRHELAVALSLVGRTAEALAELEAASRLAPADAEIRFKLALARNETGDTRGTLRALEDTVRLDPRHGRAWYNLGLARNGSGDVEGALEALQRGESASPDDPLIPYARATILLRMGRRAEARAAAEHALRLNPSFREASTLLREL